MTLYHGSTVEIKEIDLNLSKPNKDFGKGFYLSDNFEQAYEMAKYKAGLFGTEPYITKFEFDENLLKKNTTAIINKTNKIKSIYINSTSIINISFLLKKYY